mmetsp:Transcript_39284/g.111047  ORF Transcript_39284/g.111047 Transcript_39284/m.111047 type:complete len:536 (+) Transcript_39284:374-1981(+)
MANARVSTNQSPPAIGGPTTARRQHVPHAALEQSLPRCELRARCQRLQNRSDECLGMRHKGNQLLAVAVLCGARPAAGAGQLVPLGVGTPAVAGRAVALPRGEGPVFVAPRQEDARQPAALARGCVRVALLAQGEALVPSLQEVRADVVGEVRVVPGAPELPPVAVHAPAVRKAVQLLALHEGVAPIGLAHGDVVPGEPGHCLRLLVLQLAGRVGELDVLPLQGALRVGYLRPAPRALHLPPRVVDAPALLDGPVALLRGEAAELVTLRDEGASQRGLVCCLSRLGADALVPALVPDGFTVFPRELELRGAAERAEHLLPGRVAAPAAARGGVALVRRVRPVLQAPRHEGAQALVLPLDGELLAGVRRPDGRHHRGVAGGPERLAGPGVVQPLRGVRRPGCPQPLPRARVHATTEVAEALQGGVSPVRLAEKRGVSRAVGGGHVQRQRAGPGEAGGEHLLGDAARAAALGGGAVRGEQADPRDEQHPDGDQRRAPPRGPLRGSRWRRRLPRHIRDFERPHPVRSTRPGRVSLNRA